MGFIWDIPILILAYVLFWGATEDMQAPSAEGEEAKEEGKAEGDEGCVGSCEGLIALVHNPLDPPLAPSTMGILGYTDA